MRADTLSYATAPTGLRFSKAAAIAALVCSLVCLLSVGYFWLWISHFPMPDVSERVGTLGVFAIPTLAIAALIFAALARRCHLRLRFAALCGAALACMAAFSFVVKFVEMFFFTPW